MPSTSTFHRIIVVANLAKPDVGETAREMQAWLSSRGYHVTLFAFSDKPLRPTTERFDMAISLGGDGTVLFASRMLSLHQIPVLAVNMGNFGFITEVGREEWQAEFNDYRSGKSVVEERLLISASVLREGKEVSSGISLNDVVISSTGISKIVRTEVHLTGRFLGRYRSDGMIVATPTGSTAYSAAAGGPILKPDMEALILNPICPFTLSHRPIVLPASELITITLAKEQRTASAITIDGQISYDLLPGDEIAVSSLPKKARIIRSHRRTFYDVLRDKLGWSGDANA